MDPSRLSYLDYIHLYSTSILDARDVLHEYFILSICIYVDLYAYVNVLQCIN